MTWLLSGGVWSDAGEWSDAGVWEDSGTPTPTPTPGALTLDLVKQHLRVLHDDEDELIAQYMAASADYVEQATSKLLTRREVTQDFDRFTSKLPLYWGPNPDNVVVTYLDADDVEATVSGPRLVRGSLYAPASGWPSTACHSPVFVTYEAGYAEGEVPSALMSAQLLLIGHLYVNREAVSAGQSVPVPYAVDALIQPYRSLSV